MNDKTNVTTSVGLPLALHQLAKDEAQQKHMSLAALLRQALQDHLDGKPSVGIDLTGTEDRVHRLDAELDRLLVEVVRLVDRVRGVASVNG